MHILWDIFFSSFHYVCKFHRATSLWENDPNDDNEIHLFVNLPTCLKNVCLIILIWYICYVISLCYSIAQIKSQWWLLMTWCLFHARACESNHDDAHYNDVIMSMMMSQITSLTIVYSMVYSGTDQRKHQSSASLAFVRGIHQWQVNSLHKGQ